MRQTATNHIELVDFCFRSSVLGHDCALELAFTVFVVFCVLIKNSLIVRIFCFRIANFWIKMAIFAEVFQ